MDTDRLRYERASAIQRLQFPALDLTPEARARETAANETRLGLAELCDWFIQKSERGQNNERT